jgi:hypothetical protein
MPCRLRDAERNKYLSGIKEELPNGGKEMVKQNLFPYWVGLWVLVIILLLVFGAFMH